MEDLELNKTQPPPASVGLWLGYGALCVGMFMAILDIQVVVTSLAVIEDALKIGADRMSWVQTTYLIAEIISIPLTGLLIRIFTIRWLFVGAIFTFTLASIGCAFSYDFFSLILFRVLQGFAGGVLIPLVFAAIKEITRDTAHLPVQQAFDMVTKRKLKTVDVLYSSEDQLEGARAFAEKRKPQWKGR